jgi:hypothetical protein
VPETPEQLYERAKDALRKPPVEEWEAWPFEGELRPKALLPPTPTEPPRHGVGGVDCWACDTPDDAFVWTSERWRISSTREPPGLPVIVILFPRAHYADPGDLTEEVAAELGVMIARVERAAYAPSARLAASTSAAGATAASTCTGGSSRGPRASPS